MADSPVRHDDTPTTRRPWWKRWGCLLAVVGLAAAIALAPVGTIRWSGGFDQAEYHFTFVDAAGRAVPGITLRVETRAGGVCYLYPVDDFLPDRTPTSDAHGRMAFHHVAFGPEFGGKDHRNIFDVELTREEAPVYVCVFLHAGREVARVPYRDLRIEHEDYERLPKVTRPWRHTDWPFREYVAHSDDWEARRLRVFDGNGDRRLDREERVAAHRFDRLSEPPRDGWPEQEVEFVVVERTIVVPAR